MSVDTEAGGVEKEIQQDGLMVRTTVIPTSVRLGDPFYLELSVEAGLGTEVEMPPFGEALGRLTIVNFTPKQKIVEQSDNPLQVHTKSIRCNQIAVERWLFLLCVWAIVHHWMRVGKRC